MPKKRSCFLAVILLFFTLSASAQAAGASAQVQLTDDAQTHNALIAANAISSTTLSFGESFSFNDTVGAWSESAGFVSAMNGQGTEVVGGGADQAASALYLALTKLPSGSIVFDELSFYGDLYAGSYVSSGSQAIMVDYASDRDFRFTSTYLGEISITLKQDGDALVCRISLSASSQDSSAASESSDVQTGARQANASVSLDCGTDSDVLANVALAADSLYELTLAPGDLFSFNDAVGPWEEAYGYTLAVNGRGETVVGGGVDRVASGLWLLIQELPDVTIVEKTTYGSAYSESYVDKSSDAILVDYETNTDFSFRYDGEDYLTLYLRLDGSILYCSASY